MEKSTSATTDIFQKFDIAIKNKLHSIDRGYVGDKPNPEDWADLIESEKDFRDEFYRIFNDVNVEEADAHILEVLEDTYLNMELVLPRDGEGPEFARLTKQLSIPIGTANDNPIWIHVYMKLSMPMGTRPLLKQMRLLKTSSHKLTTRDTGLFY